MPCSECRLPYPEHLLQPLMHGGHLTKEVCGICALDLTNEIHGTMLRRFAGPIAEEYRQMALAWRRRHPRAEKLPAPV